MDQLILTIIGIHAPLASLFGVDEEVAYMLKRRTGVDCLLVSRVDLLTVTVFNTLISGSNKGPLPQTELRSATVQWGLVHKRSIKSKYIVLRLISISEVNLRGGLIFSDQYHSCLADSLGLSSGETPKLASMHECVPVRPGNKATALEWCSICGLRPAALVESCWKCNFLVNRPRQRMANYLKLAFLLVFLVLLIHSSFLLLTTLAKNPFYRLLAWQPHRKISLRRVLAVDWLGR